MNTQPSPPRGRRIGFISTRQSLLLLVEQALSLADRLLVHHDPDLNQFRAVARTDASLGPDRLNQFLHTRHRDHVTGMMKTGHNQEDLTICPLIAQNLR